MALYDDPELIHDMINTWHEHNREYVFPLIERLRPEVVACWEDIGFKTSMLISPEKFREFCAPLYRDIGDCGPCLRCAGADRGFRWLRHAARAVAGRVRVQLAVSLRVHGGNDLFALASSSRNWLCSAGWKRRL